MRLVLASVLAASALLACESGGAAPADTSAADTPDAASTPAAGAALWVDDATGAPVGVLVRRGGDDQSSGRAIYDLVTLFHPDSGLFFEVTMTDGVVRYPGATFFLGAGCGTPVGIGAGSCTDCRAAHGLGFLHDGVWWRVEDGAAREQRANGSSRGPGVSATCVAHGSSNTQVFPVAPVSGAAPPTAFTPPLRFSWR